MSSGAIQEKAIPIRYPSQALLCVDSANAETFDARTGMRVGSVTPSDIQVNNQRPLMFGYMTRLSLTEVNMQWNIPNVNSYNNTMTIGIWNGSGAFQNCVRVSIASDFYTLPALLNALLTQLNADASGGALNIQYQILISGEDVASGVSGETVYISKPTVQIVKASGTGSFAIIPYDAQYVIDSSGAFATGLPPLEDDLTNMLGLTPTQSTAATYYTSIYGGYASTQYTPYVDIESNFLTKNQNVADGSTQRQVTSSKLARIYLSNEGIVPREISITYGAGGIYESSSDNAVGCSPFVMRREFQTPKVISWNTTENIDVVDLQVIDYRGNLVPIDPNIVASGSVRTIGNTADFEFTIQATEQ
jgi:hypothetical protein